MTRNAAVVAGVTGAVTVAYTTMRWLSWVFERAMLRLDPDRDEP